MKTEYQYHEVSEISVLGYFLIRLLTATLKCLSPMNFCFFTVPSLKCWLYSLNFSYLFILFIFFFFRQTLCLMEGKFFSLVIYYEPADLEDMYVMRMSEQG